MWEVLGALMALMAVILIVVLIRKLGEMPQNVQGVLEQNAGSMDVKTQEALKPMAENLAKTGEILRPLQESVARLERDAKAESAKAEERWKRSVDRQGAIMKETQELARVLARPQGRGAWGQIALRRVLELAGMTDHVDFNEEEVTASGRPDVVVRLPQDRAIAIDAKTPIEHYQNSLRAEEEADREKLMDSYVKSMRTMVRDLSRKAYWESVGDRSLDFVVMFVPGDHFLNAALERDQTLAEDALASNVLLSTPSSLLAILRSAAHSWSQQQIVENAEQISKVGREFYDRAAIYAEHMGRVGRNLEGTVKAYNRSVGSWGSRVLPTAERMKELGVMPSKEIEALQEVDETPREP